MKSETCPGKIAPVLKCVYGLCIRCARLDPSGKMKPTARLESGVAVCVNWTQLRPDHQGLPPIA
jgi:hypothetical protein